MYVFSVAFKQLRLNLWNLVTKNTAYVKFPKYSDRGA